MESLVPPGVDTAALEASIDIQKATMEASVAAVAVMEKGRHEERKPLPPVVPDAKIVTEIPRGLEDGVAAFVENQNSLKISAEQVEQETIRASEEAMKREAHLASLREEREKRRKWEREQRALAKAGRPNDMDWWNYNAFVDKAKKNAKAAGHVITGTEPGWVLAAYTVDGRRYQLDKCVLRHEHVRVLEINIPRWLRPIGIIVLSNETQKPTGVKVYDEFGYVLINIGCHLVESDRWAPLVRGFDRVAKDKPHLLALE